MAKSLDFVRLETDFKGMLNRAVSEFDRYMEGDAGNFTWVFIESPETIARALEVLGEDLPEEHLARVVPKMPYLFLMFRRADVEPNIPVEATLAFLSVVNQSGMITIMRQCSDSEVLAPAFGLDAKEWDPLVFMIGGVPDLDRVHQDDTADNVRYF